jgi:hypothetical protein
VDNDSRGKPLWQRYRRARSVGESVCRWEKNETLTPWDHPLPRAVRGRRLMKEDETQDGKDGEETG